VNGDGMFERVREGFARQGIMELLGAQMGEGRCLVEVPYACFLVSLSASLFDLHKLSLQWRHGGRSTLQNTLPCKTHYLVLPCSYEKDRIGLERG
jgi:hypothetical protein